MNDSLPDAEWVAEAEAVVDEMFDRLAEPLPPRCLPPAGQPLALRQPLTSTMVVVACNPLPPADPEQILTAAFVDVPAQRSTPWWVWLGLGLVVMLATWYGRQQWQAARTPTPPPPAHQEFITYLERALTRIPVAPTPAVTAAKTPAPAVAALPPPPPVTVMPVPPAPVRQAPVPLPVPSPATSKVTPTTPVATLIGLLEMGAGSVALFQVGETTQQVAVGSQVGQSGWYLQAVRAQEVVLSRGGQTRTLLVGQGIGDEPQ
ncbi:hypothetical protein [Gloeomargarita sp.]